METVPENTPKRDTSAESPGEETSHIESSENLRSHTLPEPKTKDPMEAVEFIRSLLMYLAWILFLVGLAFGFIALRQRGLMLASLIVLSYATLAMVIWALWAILTTVCEINKNNKPPSD